MTPAQIKKGASLTVFLGEKCLNRDKLSCRQADDDSGWASGWDCDVNRWGYSRPCPIIAMRRKGNGPRGLR